MILELGRQELEDQEVKTSLGEIRSYLKIKSKHNTHTHTHTPTHPPINPSFRELTKQSKVKYDYGM